MIIFGWGHQTTKNFGPTFKRRCDHCGNEEYWVLTRSMVWFTLFFIPVFPYSIKYFLSCPICKYGLILDREQIEKIKPIAEANQLLIEGKITEREYKMRLGQLDEQPTQQVEVIPAEQKELNDRDQGSGFCSECGSKLIKAAKFCGKCGVSTAKI